MSLPAFLKKYKPLTILQILAVPLLLIVLVLFGLWLVGGHNKPKQNLAKIQAGNFVKPSTLVDNPKVIVPPKVRQITPQQLRDLLQRGEKITLVQVTDSVGWQKEHLAGSIFLPLSDFLSGPPNLPQGQAIILISTDGVDAILATERMVDNYGYGRELVESLEGGINAWVQKGYPIVKQ